MSNLFALANASTAGTTSSRISNISVLKSLNSFSVIALAVSRGNGTDAKKKHNQYIKSLGIIFFEKKLEFFSIF